MGPTLEKAKKIISDLIGWDFIDYIVSDDTTIMVHLKSGPEFVDPLISYDLLEKLSISFNTKLINLEYSPSTPDYSEHTPGNMSECIISIDHTHFEVDE